MITDYPCSGSGEAAYLKLVPLREYQFYCVEIYGSSADCFGEPIPSTSGYGPNCYCVPVAAGWVHTDDYLSGGSPPF